LEVDWGTSGKIIGKLFDSNGTTLLSQVTARSTTFTSGGIAFRATGNDKFFDTVTDARGTNNFAVLASAPSGTHDLGDLGSLPTGPTSSSPGGKRDFSSSSGKDLQDWLALFEASVNGANSSIPISLSPRGLRIFDLGLPSLASGLEQLVDLGDGTNGLDVI
jgi:hypothetical protein